MIDWCDAGSEVESRRLTWTVKVTRVLPLARFVRLTSNRRSEEGRTTGRGVVEVPAGCKLVKIFQEVRWESLDFPPYKIWWAGGRTGWRTDRRTTMTRFWWMGILITYNLLPKFAEPVTIRPLSRCEPTDMNDQDDTSFKHDQGWTIPTCTTFNRLV